MSGDLIGLRWPDGFWCPACGEAKAWPVRVRPTLFHCAACGRQTSVTAGTILPDTRTPLTTWFRAMWWVTSQRTGASAKDLQQVLGLGSYETAWTWLHKLRRAQVEVDETYLGGLEEGVRGRQTEKKALIAVAVEEAGLSYDRLEKHGYRHRITLLKGRKESARSCCLACTGWCRSSNGGCWARTRVPSVLLIWSTTSTSSRSGSTAAPRAIAGNCFTDW